MGVQGISGFRVYGLCPGYSAGSGFLLSEAAALGLLKWVMGVDGVCTYVYGYVHICRWF